MSTIFYPALALLWLAGAYGLLLALLDRPPGAEKRRGWGLVQIVLASALWPLTFAYLLALRAVVAATDHDAALAGAGGGE